MKLPAFEHLYQINAGFAMVAKGLAAFREHPDFGRRELDQLAAMTNEARACTNSYLLEVLARIETEQAGRYARKTKAIANAAKDKKP